MDIDGVRTSYGGGIMMALQPGFFHMERQHIHTANCWVREDMTWRLVVSFFGQPQGTVIGTRAYCWDVAQRWVRK